MNEAMSFLTYWWIFMILVLAGMGFCIHKILVDRNTKDD